MFPSELSEALSYALDTVRDALTEAQRVNASVSLRRALLEAGGKIVEAKRELAEAAERKLAS